MRILINLFFLAGLASLFAGCGEEEKSAASSPSSPRVATKASTPEVMPEQPVVLGDCHLCEGKPYLVVWCGLDGKDEYHSENNQARAEEIFYGYVRAGRCRSAGAFPNSTGCHCDH